MQWEKGASVVTRRIPYTDRGIYFDQSVFTSEEELNKIKKVKLCYQTNATGSSKSSVLAEFVPVIADKAALISQINILKAHSGITDKKN